MLEREAGSYMDKYKPGVTKASERLYQTLLDSKQIIPKDTLSFATIFLTTPAKDYEAKMKQEYSKTAHH